MKKTFIVVFLVLSIKTQLGIASDLPQPPTWGGHFKEIPEWWTNITDQYSERNTNANIWAQIHYIETKIKDDVGRGASAVTARRELVKYATDTLDLHKIKANDVVRLKIEIASAYCSLGDYERSITAYSELLAENPRYPSCLQALAMNYERIGDKARAREVYKFMEDEFENDKYFAAYSSIAKIGISCLDGTMADCNVPKPDWWTQFQDMPEWYTNIQVRIPKITCFRDGLDFIAVTVAKDNDAKKVIKAWEAVSQSVPLAVQDKTTLYMAVAVAYSEIGDHHRSIVNAWRVLDEFPSDTESCTLALKRIEIELKKLGDGKDAANVKKSLDCYSRASANSRR